MDSDARTQFEKPAGTLEEQVRNNPKFAQRVREVEAMSGIKVSDEVEEDEGWALVAPADSGLAHEDGINPVAAVLLALWYSVAAAGAMARGFAYLHEDSPSSYAFVNNLMWCAGIAIGIGLAAFLARSARWIVGVLSSVILSSLMLCLLFISEAGEVVDVNIFGFRPTMVQFLVGLATVTLLCGLVGTAVGVSFRQDEAAKEAVLGIRHRHWFWLWLALYAWVAIVPTAIYYVWLEVVSAFYVLIHPSLWFAEAWGVTWTTSFAFMGFSALFYGIDLSLKSVSAARSGTDSTIRRVGLFLLGTLILVGPLANILFRIGIHSLKHLPDGITANPWWVLR